ncbi:MAG TPA: MFS transporter [Rhodocyclaceae bacterium]|nr:MFS transporter [Rhodocyclaceae bacterium]
MTSSDHPRFWPIALSAAAIMLVTMGIRQSMGLFVSPIDQATGLGIAGISFAMAVAQLMWGVVQPVAGAVADRWGTGRVLVAGIVILAAGCALAPLLPGQIGLVLSVGILMATGAGIGSFSVLFGAVAQQLPANRQGLASGFINAGGSFGQFLFAPIVQRLIASLGWMGAFWTLAVAALAALPLIGKVSRGGTPHLHTATPAGGLKRAIADAFEDRSYLLLHAGFFTCGFHIAFLVTHLPGEVNLCGLPPTVASWSLAIIGLANIFGSIAAGYWVGRHRSKLVLFWMYGSRAALILLYLALPRTDLNFYLFAAGLGFTWLATVPPTARLVGKLFGTRYLATLFGLTLLTHQIGGFFGAWLGGVALARGGDYSWMWYADATLAMIAALANLPIREARMEQLAPA